MKSFRERYGRRVVNKPRTSIVLRETGTRRHTRIVIIVIYSYYYYYFITRRYYCRHKARVSSVTFIPVFVDTGTAVYIAYVQRPARQPRSRLLSLRPRWKLRPAPDERRSSVLGEYHLCMPSGRARSPYLTCGARIICTRRRIVRIRVPVCSLVRDLLPTTADSSCARIISKSSRNLNFFLYTV